MESSTSSPLLGLSEETRHLWLQTPAQKGLRCAKGISLVALSAILAVSIGGVVTAWTFSFLLNWNWIVITLASPGACFILFTMAIASCTYGVVVVKSSKEDYTYPRDLKEKKKNQIIHALNNDSFEELTYLIDAYLDNYRLVYNGLLTEDETNDLQENIQTYNHNMRIVQRIKRDDPLSGTFGIPSKKFTAATSALQEIDELWKKIRHELLFFQKRS